ncbi:MAG: hypothetical protein IT381_10355 [Deltaproteobacteria bacterium]|nr:hypothetical protein [Deltaproteobacteria bacterium]
MAEDRPTPTAPGNAHLAALAARLQLKNPQALSPALAAALGATDESATAPRHAGTLALDEVSFRIVDVEATGLSTIHDEIIEVAVYELCGRTLKKLIDTLVRPTQPLPPHIAELTGIDAAALALAPTLAEVADALLVALSGDCLVAHSAQSDLGYLSQLVRGFDPHWVCPPTACTLKLSRQLLAESSAAFGLRALAEQLHLPLPAHRAAPDALATARLLEHLIGIARERGSRTLDDLIGLSQRKAKARPEPLISPLALSALPDAPGVYRFFASDDRLLYVGQSASVRRRVREHLYRASTGASLEIVRRASRVEATVCKNELEAFVLEGEAITAEKPVLNVRNHEHGHVRFIRVSPAGAVTLTHAASTEPGVRSFGPLVLARSERFVLRALRETFGLSPRDPKIPATDAVRAFIAFAEEPLGDKPAATPQTTWEVLLDVKQSIHRAETERLDAARPFRHPTLVASARDAGDVFAIGTGRPTLRLPSNAADLHARLDAWLRTAPVGQELDASARRISGYVRAHPTRVTLQSVEAFLKEGEATRG